MAAKKKTKESEENSKKIVEIEQPNIVAFDVTIRGTAELITDQFSERAIIAMEEAQGVREKRKGGKEPKNPLRCFEESKYKTADGRDMLPGRMLQRAIRDAAVCVDDLTKAGVGRALRVISDECILKFKECYMRRDIGRNSGPSRSPDLRYRAAYRGWETTVRVEFVSQHLTAGAVRALFMWAGVEIGLGNWRPSSPMNPGKHGTFEVVRFDPVKTAKAA